MQHVAAAEHEAPRRLPDDDTQQFVLQTVATHAESLLRVAERHSLCTDDAHDAYQRGLEIFMRRAATLDRAYVDRWLHVVVKHEAMEVRRGRSEHVAVEDIDYDGHPSVDAADPEDRVLSTDRSARAAEALRRLKPQELRAIWLKALGHSYDDQLGHEDPSRAATVSLNSASPTQTQPPPPPPADTTPDATPVPPPPGPGPAPRAKAPARLKLTTLQRVGRRLTVAGALSAKASGRVTIRYRVRVRNRVHTLTKHATIRRGRYRLTFSLSPTFARPSKATISVAYAGDSDTLADARTSTWRLVR